MPKRNKIELQGLVERIVKMFYEDKMSQKDIADTLKGEGYDVSKSGVGRTLVSHASQMKAYRDAAVESAELIKELKGTPGLDVTDATTQLVGVKLLEEVKKFENFSTLEPEEVLRAVARNTDAQAKIARVRLEYERGYRKGLFEASKTIEEEGKKAGLSDESVAFIKSKVMGLKVTYDSEEN